MGAGASSGQDVSEVPSEPVPGSVAVAAEGRPAKFDVRSSLRRATQELHNMVGQY